MNGLLLKPGSQVAFAAVGVISGASLTGVPLIIKDIPIWVYVVLLVFLVLSQAGPLFSYFTAQKSMERRLRVAGEEAIRSIVMAKVSVDPLQVNHQLDVSWAVRIRDVDDRVLLDRRTDKLKPLDLPLLDSTATRVRIVPATSITGRETTPVNVFGGCKIQAATGFRYEVFYEMPVEFAEREASLLGSGLLTDLIADHMVGLIARIMSPD